MNYKQALKKSLQSALIMIKLVIPIYIIADILYFYNTLSYISFLVEPFTQMIGLPAETGQLAIISGIFLNLYAAVAFAAPLDMTPHQWSILAVFLGVCHSLVVEGVIMKKIGISNIYSYSLRFCVGLFLAYLTYLIPSSWFEATLSSAVFEKTTYDSFAALIYGSISSAVSLSIKIILLITVLIFIMDFIKSRKFVVQSQKNVSKGFSIVVGVFLGITYGAGILIDEVKSGNIKKEDIFYIATFLMISHAIIEDTLLFVIFGADFTMVIAIRTIAAIVLSYILLKIYQLTLSK
ncbi:MAG: nucleoside recognition protein [Campylobacterota bacterium]|nr:nucleoside recognition protein [Campylobacterota bacterium]